jgi:peptidyl-tRNA hydrolase
MYEEWEDVLCVAQSNQDKTGEWWRDWLTHKAKKILAKVEGK